MVTQTEFDEVFPNEATTKDKQIFQLLDAGDAFVNPVASATTAVISTASSSISGIDTLLSDPFIAPGDAAALGDLKSSLQANFAGGAVLSFQDHTNKITSLDTTLASDESINKRIAVAQGTNIANTAFNLPASDTCSKALDMFQSVLAAGQALIDQASQIANNILQKVNDAVAAVTGALADLVSSVAGFVNDIVNAANAIIDRVNQDIQAFLDGIDLLIKTSFAKLLGNALSIDPCLQVLLNEVGTPILQSTLQI